MKTYPVFLEQIIEQGIAAAQASYVDKPEKLKGAVSGFNSCRNKTPPELAEHLQRSKSAHHRAFLTSNPSFSREPKWSWYWWIACYVAEVEWVCNVVSAALFNQDMPVIVQPTARGMMQAAKILGVAQTQEFLN